MRVTQPSPPPPPSEDTCHYPKTADLDEYVLNNRGRIWVGSAYNNYGRPWQFAQFQRDSLEVALWILEKMRALDRTDPVKVYLLTSRIQPYTPYSARMSPENIHKLIRRV